MIWPFRHDDIVDSGDGRVYVYVMLQNSILFESSEKPFTYTFVVRGVCALFFIRFTISHVAGVRYLPDIHRAYLHGSETTTDDDDDDPIIWKLCDGVPYAIIIIIIWLVMREVGMATSYVLLYMACQPPPSASGRKNRFIVFDKCSGYSGSSTSYSVRRTGKCVFGGIPW